MHLPSVPAPLVDDMATQQNLAMSHIHRATVTPDCVVVLYGWPSDVRDCVRWFWWGQLRAPPIPHAHGLSPCPSDDRSSPCSGADPSSLFYRRFWPSPGPHAEPGPCPYAELSPCLIFDNLDRAKSVRHTDVSNGNEGRD